VTFTAIATDAVDGVVPVACTPASGGTFALGTTPVTCTATDTAGNTATGSFKVTVTVPPLTVSTTTLPAGQVGIAYPLTAQLTSTGGTAPVTWSLTGGASLPAGLSLSTAGAITGTPTAAGTTNFTVQATDSGKPAQTATSQQMSITVAQAAQTITFTSTLPANAKVGPPVYHVTATASSGLQVTFSIDSSSTPGTCAEAAAPAGETQDFTVGVAIRGPGTCIIDANQSGNANYTAAPQVQQTIKVGNSLSGTSPSTITGTAKASLTATAGSFSDPNKGAAATAFTASINWGDNSPASTGTVSGSNGSFSVGGTHTYQLDGTYQIVTTVNGDGASVSIDATANIGEQVNGITVTGAAISSAAIVEGTALSSVTVATFADAGAVTPASGYSATIDWGDGSATSAGSIGASGNNFNVSGTHTYSEEGKYATKVTVTKGNVVNGTGSGAGSIVVNDADKLTGTAASPIIATVGTALSNTPLATFSDVYAGHADSSDFSATINWGDNTPAAMGTVSGSGGSFTVTGSHTYGSKGAYTLSVTLSDKAPASDSSLTVASATVTTPASALASGGSTACSGTDLSYCNFSSQSLQGKNLKGGNLTGSDLEGVSLQGANLQGATLSGANLQGANTQGLTR
jgi:hypothetical protein